MIIRLFLERQQPKLVGNLYLENNGVSEVIYRKVVDIILGM
jgi:hypothetical protein